LPGYKDFGFAVFKLKRSPRRFAGLLRRLVGAASREPLGVHPMAFDFPRRNPGLLYFPTLHIHDRQVHPHATFDHTLYCQPDEQTKGCFGGWEESLGPASGFMDAGRAEGVVSAVLPCWRMPLQGRLENKDALVGKGGAIPA